MSKLPVSLAWVCCCIVVGRRRCRSSAAAPALADVSIDGAGLDVGRRSRSTSGAADVARQGLSVNYQGVGSTSGRVFYYQNQVDFAASEIPFTPAYRDATGSVITNEVALAAHRPVRVHARRRGRHVVHVPPRRSTASWSRSLRLTPTELAKIFTGVITNWNDPAIAQGQSAAPAAEPSDPARRAIRRLGHDRAVHRVHGEPDARRSGTRSASRSGSTSTRARRCRCGPTSTRSSQQFSDGVADYVAAPYNNGAITYVEYGYAKQRGFPVASMLNKAGYFTQPTAGQRRDRARRRRRSTPTSRRTSGACTRTPTRARTRCRATAT